MAELGSTTGTYWNLEMKTAKVVFVTDGADVAFGRTGGPSDDMASSVPPLAPSSKINTVEEINGSLSDNMPKGTK